MIFGLEPRSIFDLLISFLQGFFEVAAPLGVSGLLAVFWLRLPDMPAPPVAFCPRLPDTLATPAVFGLGFPYIPVASFDHLPTKKSGW